MLNSLIGLQEKASAFFNEYESKYALHMNCASGCSHCCIGGLTIFTWEAELIINWFDGLPSTKKEKLLEQWKSNLNSDFTDVEGKATKSCNFLVNNQCSIYPRRPMICRTQGMGLKWSEEGKILRDCCPLNFTNNTTQSKEEDELNLDVLNHMISQAQMLFSNQHRSSIISQHSNERIELKELREHLMQRI